MAKNRCFQFVKALLNSDKKKLELLGVTIVGSSPESIDCGNFVFGSTEAYEQAMEEILTGEIEEVSIPQAKDIAVYVDHESNVVHVGRVEQDETGNIKVVSKIAGSTLEVRHDPNLMPTDVPGHLRLTWYRKSI